MFTGTLNGHEPTFFHRAVRFFRDHERQSWSAKQIEDALLDLEVNGVLPPLFKTQYNNDPIVVTEPVFVPANQTEEETTHNA